MLPSSSFIKSSPMLILGHTIRLLEEAGGDETNEVLPESGGRFVAENSRSGNIRGRTILTILYMCVLGLCFVIPVFYCIRVYYEERNARRLRELEIAGIAQAMEQSQLGREESRAARRKYREEQRARIVQLFAPVRMILKQENFPHLQDQKTEDTTNVSAEVENDPKLGIGWFSLSFSEDVPAEKEAIEREGSNKAEDKNGSSEEQDIETGQPEAQNVLANVQNTFDEDETFIEVPVAGLPQNLRRTPTKTKLRLVPNVCTICLCNYEIGSDVVWSSNEACEHVFHGQCIEQWLMKQREGPLCPCCRRDFIVDPYDMEEGEEEEVYNCNDTNSNGNGDSSSNNNTTPVVPAEGESETPANTIEGTAGVTITTDSSPEIEATVDPSTSIEI